MREGIGLGAALLSSALGGLSVALTRMVIESTDPITLGGLRFSIGCVALIPLLAFTPSSKLSLVDRCKLLALGTIFFCLSPILFNSVLMYTTAAHGALAMSTVPLLTMVIGAKLGTETFSRMKGVGVLIGVIGVGIALGTTAPGLLTVAWFGNLLMVASAVCMAIYSALSAPLIIRIGAVRFTVTAMGIGGLELAVLSYFLGRPATIFNFTTEWFSILYLGIIGGALTSLLWVLALHRTPPTLVAASVTVHPMTAAASAAVLIGESMETKFVIGTIVVAIGIFATRMGSAEREVER